MTLRNARSMLLAVMLLLVFTRLDVPRSDAQSFFNLGRQFRNLASAYMQTNQPGSSCSTQLSSLSGGLQSAAISGANHIGATLGATLGGLGYGWGNTAFRPPLNLGQTMARRPHAAVRGVSAAQTEEPPYTYVDPKTGATIVVDSAGHGTLTDPDGSHPRPFDVFMNYFNEPVVNIQSSDGIAQRMSFDGYSAEIDPDEGSCALCDALETYDLDIDPDGNLLFTDDEGNEITLAPAADGSFAITDAEGNHGEFGMDGSFKILDKDSAVLDSGDIENPTAEDRAKDLGIPYDDGEAFYQQAFANGGFDPVDPNDVVHADEYVPDDANDNVDLSLSNDADTNDADNADLNASNDGDSLSDANDMDSADDNNEAVDDQSSGEQANDSGSHDNSDDSGSANDHGDNSGTDSSD